MAVLAWLGLSQAAWAEGDAIIARGYFTDASGHLSLAEARGQLYKSFDGLLPGSYHDGATWVRLRLAPQADTATPLVLSLRPARLDRIELFDPDAPPGPDAAPPGNRLAGDRQPPQPLPFAALDPVFVVPASSAPRELFLRVVSTSSHALIVRASPLPTAAHDSAVHLIYVGFYLAFLAAVGVVGAVAYRIQRDRLIGLFALKQFALLLLLLFLSGAARLLLVGPVPPAWIDLATSAMLMLSSAAVALFDLRLLREGQAHRRAWWLTHALFALPLGGLLLLMAGQVREGLLVFIGHPIVSPLVSLALAFTCRGWGQGGVHQPVLLPKAYLVGYFAISVLVLAPAPLAAAGGLIGASLFLETFVIYAVISSVMVSLLLWLRQRRLALVRVESQHQLDKVNRELEVVARADRAKAEFATHLSHELRTPLNAILGYGQLLAEDQTLKPAQRALLDDMRQAAQHMEGLTRESLDLMRLEAGRADLAMEPCSLAECFRDVEVLTQPMAQSAGIEVRWTEPHLPRVRADHVRLRQVLLNLVSNAIKYNRPGGMVFVSAAARDGGTLRVAVRDTGMGIDAPTQARLFQPFERGAATRQQADGTGMGLAICKRLMEAMGGQIGVHATPGAGSEFWFDLLAADEAAAPIIRS